MTMTQERPAEAVDSFAALSAAVHPAWHQAILRLASATERVATKLEMLCATHGGDGRLQTAIRDLIPDLLEFLDETDADPDLEPYLADCAHDDNRQAGDDREADDGDEPSLGWTDREAGSGRHVTSSVLDRELDRSDDEPSLGSPVMNAMSEYRSQEDWADGGRDDREEDSSDDEPGGDDEPGDGWPMTAA